MYSIDSVLCNDKLLQYIDIPGKNDESPLLVFLHGFPDNAYGWEFQLNEFKGNYHVLAPFMHGTLNGEDIPNDRITLEKIRKDLATLLIKMNPDNQREVYIVGHDLGCFLGTAFSVNSRFNVKGLININGVGLDQYVGRKFSFTQWRRSYYVILAQFNVVRSLVSKVMPKAFLNIIYTLCGIEKNNPIRNNDRKVLSSIYIYRYLFKKAATMVFGKETKIAVPTLFIWGKDDRFLNFPTKKEVDKFCTNATIRILPGGHWVLRTDFVHVNRIIKKTLGQWQAQAVTV